ncbi:UNVERIFIED_CONTAM: hypothetical protein FKN15_078089 [Acipenser sinensis]
MSCSQTVWAGELNGVPIIGSSKASVELAWALAKGNLELVKKIQNEMIMQATGMITPLSSASSEASQCAAYSLGRETCSRRDSRSLCAAVCQ